jgi:hypothetical protein
MNLRRFQEEADRDEEWGAVGEEDEDDDSV